MQCLCVDEVTRDSFIQDDPGATKQFAAPCDNLSDPEWLVRAVAMGQILWISLKRVIESQTTEQC